MDNRLLQFEKDRRLWERENSALFPGRKWGIELNCTVSADSVGVHSRALHAKYWINYLLKSPRIGEAYVRKNMFWGLEVGACNMPVRLRDSQIRMRYLDFVGGSDNDHCFNKGDNVAAQIIDDAQSMSKVEAASFDFILGYHVLEHLSDFFGAIKAWMRSVKKGGIIIFGLPSPCDQQWNHGESLRLVTNPSHFAEEFEQPTRLEQNSLEHLKEAALAIWGMQEENKPKIQAPTRLLNRLDKCTKLLRTSKHKLNFTMQRAIDAVSMPLVPVGDIQCLVDNLLMSDPNRAHLHVWSLHSLKAALALAQKLMSHDLRFDIVSTQVAARGAFSMEEFRVVLRRS